MALDSIFEQDSEFVRGEAADFSQGDPMAVFLRLTLYAEFDSPDLGRKPVARTVPGSPGRWVLAYSSVERLRMARGDDDVEYSWMNGAHLLEEMPGNTGVWFDRSFPGGRPILMPPPEFTIAAG